MSSKKRDASYFSDDILELITLLHTRAIQYVIVGGVEIAWHSDFFEDALAVNETPNRIPLGGRQLCRGPGKR